MNADITDTAIFEWPWLLRAAAAGQLAIAILNLCLIRILGWREDLARMPLLVRQVFHVHCWFISVTLTLFAVMTWRFAGEFSTNAVCRWLAAGIGLFWALRTVLQATYYSSSHWRGQTGRTAIHAALLAIYGGFATVYAMAAFGGG
ncbi:MAG: hypothetical protein HY735_01675 [Verrucomicrobia bacterium]|nr:hypothetical protein [Verrucomicrobiota bacterium]